MKKLDVGEKMILMTADDLLRRIASDDKIPMKLLLDELGLSGNIFYFIRNEKYQHCVSRYAFKILRYLVEGKLKRINGFWTGKVAEEIIRKKYVEKITEISEDKSKTTDEQIDEITDEREIHEGTVIPEFWKYIQMAIKYIPNNVIIEIKIDGKKLN